MRLSERLIIASALALAGFVFTGGVQAIAQAIRSEESATASTEAAIQLANRGGLRDWRALDESKIYLQDSGGNWYLATLATPAPDMPYATTIGFETKGVDRLDKFGAIVISGARYPLASLVASAAPPPRKRAN